MYDYQCLGIQQPEVSSKTVRNHRHTESSALINGFLDVFISLKTFSCLQNVILMHFGVFQQAALLLTLDFKLKTDMVLNFRHLIPHLNQWPHFIISLTIQQSSDRKLERYFARFLHNNALFTTISGVKERQKNTPRRLYDRTR